MTTIKANYDKFLSLDQAKMIPIYNKVLGLLRPFVLAILSTKFDKAGLKDDSGNLRKCIDSSTLHLSKKGLRISPGGGFDKSVYVRLNVFTFGGVYGSGVKSKAIKKKIKKHGAEGVKIIEGKGMYKLTSEESESVITEFERLLELELDKVLK